jgi:glycosyltransferase involved in cell wall biosynthesis
MRTGLTGWFTGRALRGADQLIMVSDEMRGLVVKRFGADPALVHTIINGVDATTFYPRTPARMRQKLGLPEDSRIIIYVGRFLASKGLRELLEAFAALAETDAGLRLVLIGDGVMREELHARIAAAHCSERVHLPGAMQPKAIAEWIGAADLLCLPSYSEGYPNVVVEALASGRPVVATDVGGIPELVNDTNGRLVAPGDAVALQRALAQVLERSWDHQAIAATWSRSWDDVARATLAVCQLACQGAQKG